MDRRRPCGVCGEEGKERPVVAALSATVTCAAMFSSLAFFWEHNHWVSLVRVSSAHYAFGAWQGGTLSLVRRPGRQSVATRCGSFA